MARQVMEIEIGDDGMTVKTSGYTGTSCLKDQQALQDGLKELGLKVELQSKTMTGEAKVAVKVEQKVG
jgi:hypothetical protein